MRDLEQEFYKLTEVDKKTKSLIVGLKSLDDTFFETDAGSLGACFNKKIEIDGEHELYTKIGIEIHQGEERKRFSYDPEKGKGEVLKDETTFVAKTTQGFFGGCI
jgi:hypothetical protein